MLCSHIISKIKLHKPVTKITRNNNLQTYHIHINGIVQGVGFRPMVYQLAKEMQLKGYVKNGSDGLHIFFNASQDVADLFFKRIKQQAPPKSKITSAIPNKIDEEEFTDFSIVVEEDKNEKQVLLSPDIAICTDCKNELHDKNNFRHHYAFITCTQCGPRYSIINDLPYERHNTAMQKFVMCKSCNDEYNNVSDRRFFSQTNSCADCGIELAIHENNSDILSNNSEDILFHINNFFAQGKIIAVKGIGGYLLLCDANNAEAILLLRNRKHTR